MLLNTTSMKLQVVLAGAKATNDCPVMVQYDAPSEVITKGTQLTSTNGVTAADVLTAPTVGTNPIGAPLREVKKLTINNADTANVTATVRINDGTNTWTVVKQTIAVGDTLVYTPERGWHFASGTAISATGALTVAGLLSLTDVETGITAHAGGGQASAYALTHMVSRIATVATGNDSVVLPAATVGKVMIVANMAAANSANVYPVSGEAINAASADAAFALAANKRALFYCDTAGKWNAILTA